LPTIDDHFHMMPSECDGHSSLIRQYCTCMFVAVNVPEANRIFCLICYLVH